MKLIHADEPRILIADEPFPNVEMCQITDLPKEELDPMHLCLCPNCTAKYKMMRTNETDLEYFLKEIRELMTLQEEADKYEDSPEKKYTEQPKQRDDSEFEITASGTDVYKDYIGKRVFHTKQKMYGIVRTCDGEYLGIEFENGPKKGQIKKYSLQVCLSDELITIV